MVSASFQHTHRNSSGCVSIRVLATEKTLPTTYTFSAVVCIMESTEAARRRAGLSKRERVSDHQIMKRLGDRKDFITQLRERKVIRVAVAYLIVGWVVLQIGEVTFEALGLPDWSLTLLIVLVVLGIPLALVLAWAYELTPDGIRRDPKDLPAPAEPPLPELDHAAPSIAVLPFDDLSEKRNQAYFCEGIAEEILTALCMIPNLRVASRVAAFQFSGKSADLSVIGRKLNVQTVLEGSVRKSGDRLRITAQLVKTADGYHLWSQQFDRRLEDIFEIQAEIANAIARALSVTLKSQGLKTQQKVDSKAYDFFLRGLSFPG